MAKQVKKTKKVKRQGRRSDQDTIRALRRDGASLRDENTRLREQLDSALEVSAQRVKELTALKEELIRVRSEVKAPPEPPSPAEEIPF